MEKYQITKTIRFKLEPVNGKTGKFEDEIRKLGNKEEAEASLHNLISLGKDLSTHLKSYIYYEDKKKNLKLKKSVSVHFRWLREFTKDQFFEWRNGKFFENAEDKKDNTNENKSKSGGGFAQLKVLVPDLVKENKNSHNKEKRFKLTDVKYLAEVFERFNTNWDNAIQNLSDEISKPKESLTRKAEIGKIVRLIGTRNNLPFLEKFIIESNEKDESQLETQLKDRLEAFKENLKKAELWTLPAQSSGIELAKASFNYYTINKKEKDFEQEKSDIERQLFKTNPIYKEKDFLEEVSIIKIVKDETRFDRNKPYSQENKPIEKYFFLYELSEQGILTTTNEGNAVTLDLLYKTLKTYKANQKKHFKDLMDKNPTYEDIIKSFNLFNPIDPKNPEKNIKAFNKYKELTARIQKLGAEINTAQKDTLHYKNLKEESSKLKQQRGKLFFAGKSQKGEPEGRFEKFLKFCSIYKDISMKRGKLVARLKGIEKEKIDAKRLQYWSFLVEKENRHELILIPKDNSQEAYRKISSFREGNADSTVVYYFESLTYRALRKLCFGVNGNSFLPEIQAELQKKNKWNYEERDFGEHIFKIKNGQEEVRDDKKLISFYKDVIQTDYVQKNREDGKIVLPSNFEEEVLRPDFSTEQEFKTALEKCCYLRKKVIPGNELSKIISSMNAQVFSITSYNLEGKGTNNLKDHTKLWYKFWNAENEKERFPLRLNPEIKILWREPKATRIDKYGEGTPLYDKNKKNRYLYPQFTLTTSFLENAHQPEINYAFQDLNQKKETIKAFNAKIKNEFKKQTDLWLYGIDTGIVELASLCLIKKDGSTQLFDVLELKDLNYEKVGFLKDKTPKSYRAIQNLSYFLNEDLYKRTFLDDKFQETFDKIFERKQVVAIDLSSAKVINGHIVLNGDISARLNLSLSNARRKIVEVLISDSSLPLSEENYIIKMGNTEIFRGRQEFNSVKTWETIQAILKESFERDKENLGRVQEDIGKYSNAVAANILGIIHSLYKKFPGVITIEYLDQSEIESHRNQFGGIIDNPVERAISRKFQSEGLVPPVSEIWNIKGKNMQIGIIYFADSKDEKRGAHSTRCPNCSKKAYTNSDDPEYIGDKKKDIPGDKDKKIFKCKHCTYHNKENPMGLIGLDSNDKVAAYNIAKRGLELLS